MLSRVVRGFITLIQWLELALFTLVLWLLSWLPGIRLNPVYLKLFHFWCRVFVDALGVDLRLHHKNIRPIPRQYILIANHPSAFEDVGIPSLFNVRCLAKAEVRDWWLVGRIGVPAGTLYVHRESRKSRRNVVRKMIRALEAGDNIALYPEGGCLDKRLHERFHPGAFELSLRTGVPVLPIFLHYEAQNDFAWPDDVRLISKLWDIMTTRNNRANYYLYDAFHPEEFSDREEYCQHVYECYLGWQQRYLD